MSSLNSTIDSLRQKGWSEGPRRLQGYKALDKEHPRHKTEEMVSELTTFLDRPLAVNLELVRAARDRALAVLSALRQQE